MRRALLLVIAFVVIFAALNRQKLYLRDPLATIYRDEVKQNAWIFINYSNDVLVQSSELPHAPIFLVQHWDNLPGIPMAMNCLLGIVCVAEKAHAPMQGWTGARTATMTNRQITFADGDDTHVRVTLR